MFSVSTKTQYGIRALIYLARKGQCPQADGCSLQGTLASTAEIASAESISPKYLEGIMTQLKMAGILEAERGKGGGYRLSRDPSQVKMLDVVETLEGEVIPVGCVGNSELCAQGKACLPRLFWVGLKEAIDEYLKSRTLKDIMQA